MIKLSILVLTTPRRRSNLFQSIIGNLEKQAEGLPVEIIGLYDNKKRTVGAKRNAALKMAQGEYTTFTDDDDVVAIDYVKSILDCIKANPGVDVIVFDCETTVHKEGVPDENHYSKYGKDFVYSITPGVDKDGFRQWRGKPAHTMVWRTEIAKIATFPDKNYAEDVGWVALANQLIKTEARIDKVLYYYMFNSNISETRG